MAKASKPSLQATKLPAPIIVGWTSQPRSDAQDGLAPITADKRLTDPAKVENSIRERTQKLLNGLKTAKVTGEVTDIFAIDVYHGRVFSTQNLWTPVRFLDWLFEEHENAFQDFPKGEREVAFFGFDVGDFVSLLGFQLLKDCAVPSGFWCGNDLCFDPYRMCVESEWREQFTLNKVLTRLGISGYNDHVLHTSARADALLAAEMVTALKLITPFSCESLENVLDEQRQLEDAEEPEAVSVGG